MGAFSIKSNTRTGKMNAAIQTPASRVNAEQHFPQRRAVDRLLASINQTVENSKFLVSKSLGQFDSAGQTYTLPRYVFLGPKGGGDTVRIGIFATIHGDE